jgi:two-component system sensor histidine kinase UhpB
VDAVSLNGVSSPKMSVMGENYREPLLAGHSGAAGGVRADEELHISENDTHIAGTVARTSGTLTPELAVKAGAVSRSSAWPFWHRLPILGQVMIAYLVIAVTAAVGAGIVIIMNARAATQAEMRGALEIAERYTRETIRSISPETQGKELAERIPIHLKYLRHVRIIVIDPNGKTTLVSKSEDEAANAQHLRSIEETPRWFATLIQPEPESRQIVTMLGDFRMGTILIVGEPADEIAEVWEDVSSLALIGLAMSALGLAALMLILRRILWPLTNLSNGLTELRQFRYGMRLPVPDMRETAVIAERFNALAEALEGAHIENRRLYRHLLTVQENERKVVANELHDEAGPCLFSLQINASSIQKLADRIAHEQSPTLRERAETMLAVIARLQKLNRDLLVTLRPVALGRVSLSDLITDLVDDFSRQYHNVTFVTDFGDLRRSYGEMIDIAIYRCVQEGMANAMRHAGAENLIIGIGEEDGGSSGRRRIEITIKDDGRGIEAGTPLGFGLQSLRERMLSLGGSCALETDGKEGAILRAAIPVSDAETLADS